jgi:hypothetical protein
MSDGDPLAGDEPRMPGGALGDDVRRSMKVVRESIEHDREHHARTGEWPSHPVLDEIDEIRREIMAEHGNDCGKVLQWHREQDKLFVQQNPNARFVERPGVSASLGSR